MSFALMLSGSPAVLAHPHSWIDMKTHIEGKEGVITGFQMEWIFDAMSSAFMLEGEKKSPQALRKALDGLTASVMENIKNEHYFTHFLDGNRSVDFGTATDATFSRNRARLVLTFNLPLLKPQPLRKDSLKLEIFEPTHYTDMSWPAKNSVSLSDELAKQCELELVRPNPTPQQMSYALALPEDADPDHTLGQLFTQSIRFHCSVNQQLTPGKASKEVRK
ncbi:DUF1007 family protein [Endozoicomonas montiporae]|uniref:DUF1007 family protein n=1 Tax=Endozoicomonas montiporae CL-33 TaxID=570277 RepID=A0A142B777_9GAMM|nr:DUF1007 family protein [Endozoicomonas montiporae]AMO54603.1 hypothetical protein EZMO1_0351 [Endozoicomonas montiporae CL-33]